MKTLKKGNRGDDVIVLQKALKALGYDVGAVDGDFGPRTEKAVKAFQTDQGLTADGIVGPKTWAKLGVQDAQDTSGLGLKKSSRKITEIIVHCTATKEGDDTTVEAIRRYHMKERGFSDIGYHYLIYLDGSIHEGRSVHQPGAHCSGHNQNSIGVCYVGGLARDGKPKDTRTKAQRESLVKLVRALMDLYKLPSNRVFGHYQFANKACPSFKIDQLRLSLCM